MVISGALLSWMIVRVLLNRCNLLANIPIISVSSESAGSTKQQPYSFVCMYDNQLSHMTKRSEILFIANGSHDLLRWPQVQYSFVVDAWMQF